MNFECAYARWQSYIRKCVRLECKRYRLPELDFDDLVWEAWTRIWEYWPSVEKAQKPIVVAGLLAKQWVTQAAIKITGHKVMCRGKLRFWAGSRQRPALSQLLPLDEHGEPDWGTSLVLANLGRGRRLDNPVMIAILREELERFGNRPSELFRYYLGDSWVASSRDAHLRDEWRRESAA